MELPVQQEEHLEELEANRQELHAARRHIDILTANVKHLENENTELGNALTEATQQRKGSLCSNQGKNDNKYRQQVEDLQQMLEDAQASERMAKDAERRLEQQLQLALEMRATTTHQNLDNDDDDDHVAALQLQISELEEDRTSLKMKLYESAVELKQKIDEISRLQGELAEKTEEIECMESQFNSQCDINQRLREENSEMRSKLEAESAHVDMGKKGNSLFAEVDDRRVVAEKKIMKLEALIRELEEKLTKEQKENKRQKLQILLLRQTSNKGYDDNIVRNLQNQLLESKRSIIELTEQLQKKSTPCKYQPKEAKFTDHGGTTDSDKLFINFLQGIITQKKKEAETANALSQQNHLKALRTELHLTEVQNEVTSLTSQCERLKAMNSHLTIAIQEIQRKYEPELFAPPSKEKIKIPNPETESTSFPQSGNSRQNVVKTGTGFSQVGQQKESQFEDHWAAPAEPVKELTDSSKENIPLKASNNFPGNEKSVRMMPIVNVVSSNDALATAELKGDGKGQRIKKSREAATGKYKNVTYMDMEETQPTECKQQ